MKNFFKPEDFEGTYGHYQKELHIEYCRLANEKLNALIESWPVVYDGDAGISCFNDNTWGYVKYDENNHSMISSNFRNSRRKARLAFIEEIVKEPCKHEAKSSTTTLISNDDLKFKCSKCGVELQATWTEKK